MRARVMAVLAVPWVIAFVPGREALVTERYALFRGAGGGAVADRLLILGVGLA
jgi:hypothetical protein